MGRMRATGKSNKIARFLASLIKGPWRGLSVGRRGR